MWVCSGGRCGHSCQFRDLPGAAASFAHYLKAADNDADRQMGYFLLGQTLASQGDDAKAKTALREAVRLNADAEITRLAGQMLK